VARLTQRQRQETVRVFYGINSQTLEVDRVTLDRGGTLWRMGRNMISTHHPTAGRDPRVEAIIVFNLTDIIDVPWGFEDADSTKQKIANLEATAAQRRAVRDRTG
jgi:hypothetical protein